MNFRQQELVFGVVLFTAGAFLYYHTYSSEYANLAQDMSIGPMFFPRLLLFGWLCCAFGMILQALRKPETHKPFLWGRVLGALGTLAFFTAFFNLLGFIVVGFVSFCALSWIIGFRRIGVLLATSCVYVVCIDALFRLALQCYLPPFSLFGE